MRVPARAARVGERRRARPAGRRTSSLVERAGELVAACPLYLKDHSYGEYVFDWAWADAYQRHGLDYYPKLLGAVPFTPVPGPRLLARDARATALLLLRAIEQLARDGRLSSAHVLFLDDADQAAARDAGWSMRSTVQFHWTQPRRRRPTPTSPTSSPACSARSARRSSRSGAASPTPASTFERRAAAPRSAPPTGTSSTAATPSPTAPTTRRPT